MKTINYNSHVITLPTTLKQALLLLHPILSTVFGSLILVFLIMPSLLSANTSKNLPEEERCRLIINVTSSEKKIKSMEMRRKGERLIKL